MTWPDCHNSPQTAGRLAVAVNELHQLEAGASPTKRSHWEIQVRCVYYWLRDGGVVVCGLPAEFLWGGRSYCEEHIDDAISGHTYGARVRQGRR